MQLKPRTYPELYHASGIYMIKNIVTGEEYIGSSNRLGKRWSSHSRHLQRNIHSNPKLQASYNFYGDGAFVFGVIEFVGIDKLFEREQYHYDLRRPVFNLSDIVKSPFTGKKLSDEHKRKCSLSNIGKNKGKIRNSETKELLRSIALLQDRTKLYESMERNMKEIIVWYNEITPVLFKNKREVVTTFGLENKNRVYVNLCCNVTGFLFDANLNKYKIEYA